MADIGKVRLRPDPLWVREMRWGLRKMGEWSGAASEAGQDQSGLD